MKIHTVVLGMVSLTFVGFTSGLLAGPLIDCGAHFGVDMSAMDKAVCEMNVDQVKSLLESGKGDANTPDSKGYTPLDVAFHSSPVYYQPVSPSMEPVIKLLLKFGANPIKAFLDGHLPLDVAARMTHMELLSWLIHDGGADVNAHHGKAGYTALHEAALCDFRISRGDQAAKSAISYLIANGADIHTKTYEGDSVLDVVPTPCSFAPELCAADKLATAKWPSGSCKLTYLYVKQKLAE